MKRPSFHPLSRAYWPAGTSYPALRTVLAFVLAPVVVVALLLLLLFGAEVGFGGGADTARMRAMEFAPVALISTCVILWSGGIAVFALLWSLRLRGRRAYALAGMALGLTAALALPMLGSAPGDGGGTGAIGLVPVIVMAVHFGIVMLALRAIAGVRRIHE